MDINENASLREKIAKSITQKIEVRNELPPFPCVLAFLGEPKMPEELFMDDCED